MYWNKNNTIIEKEQNDDPKSCFVCGKIVNWIETESPKNKIICPSCGYTQSKDKYKLLIDNYGYKIVYEIKNAK